MYGLMTASLMKEIEKYTIETLGIPSIVLMEKAAMAVCDEIRNTAADKSRIAVFSGVGNNGADGIAIARILRHEGYDTAVYIVGDEQKSTEEFRLQKRIFCNCGGMCRSFEGVEAVEADIIVDALLGIGISRDLEGDFLSAVRMINDLKNENACKVVAVDIPSGINTDTGDVMGEAVRADITVCLGEEKIGIRIGDSPDYAGRVVLADINTEGRIGPVAYVMEEADIKGLLPVRRAVSNKATYGKLLVIAGSEEMPGASLLCARVAFKAGVGMVKLYTDTAALQTVMAAMPEIMVSDYNEHDIREAFEWSDTAIIGPGLGRTDKAYAIVKTVIEEFKKPLIIDADGINIIKDNPKLLDKRKDRITVITPHPKEFAGLFQTSLADRLHKNPEYVKQKAGEMNMIIVAKDASTIITDGKDVYVNTTGTNALATAGTGDVLSGLIAGLTAEGGNALEACIAATYIHGRAGAAAAEKMSDYSVTASDVIDKVINVMHNLTNK